MIGELVQVRFSKIMQTRAYTVVVIGTDEKRIPIYADPSLGHILQIGLTGQTRSRPLTHDLIGAIFSGLGVRLKHVVINNLQGTVYYARLFLEQEREGRTHIIEVDARPSDCIPLALLAKAPVYCTKEVLDKAVPVED
ncbi:MAG: bifunctional nuclease family protein [Parachlamydiales bacterium]